MAPKDVFNLNPSLQKDLKEIERIRKNIKASFSNKITTNDVTKDQKALLYNVVTKKSKSLISNSTKKNLSFKKGFFIPVTVVEVYQSSVKIQIDKIGLIIDSKVNKDEFYKVSLDLIRLISERDWMSAL